MAEPDRGLRQWVLVGGNRYVVAGLFLLGTFLLLAGLGYAGVITTERNAVRGVAGGFVPGLIAFLSIVLAINQLVLSQEFGSAGEIRERVEAVREYRRDVEETAGEGPSPVLPTGFLAFVVNTIAAEARDLESQARHETDAEVRDAVRSYARTVAEEATASREALERARPGRIHALIPVLEYDESAQLYEARRLQYEDGGDLAPETRDALAGLIDALELFSVARTQFRSTYTQRVLARLSRLLLYVGLPALVVVIVLGLLEPTGPYLSTVPAPVIVGAMLTAALSPLVVLAAYLLRVSAVSERTIAAGPFVSRPPVPGERPVDDAAPHANRETDPRSDDPPADDSER